MKTIKIFAIITIGSYILTGCKGDTGAQGPQGNPGSNGVANISTDIYTISPGTWTNVNATYAYQYPIYVQDINNSGDVIEVYWSSISANGPWLGLPDPSEQFNYEWTTSNNNPNFWVLWQQNPSLTIYVEIAIVPPAIQVKHPHTNWKDANAVAAIPEVHNALYSSH